MRIIAFILPLTLLLSITACTYDHDSSTTARGAAPAPVKQETVAPIPTAMDTFRALAPPEGLRFTPLFNEPVGNTDARLKRLEDAVQTIRNDVDTIAPTMVRMVAIEKDIKGLVAQLQTLSDQGNQPAAANGTVAPTDLLPAMKQGSNKIPGEDVARGTEPAKALPAKAGPDTTSSSLVTPEAASTGELPPDGAASPNSSADAPNSSVAAPDAAAPQKPAKKKPAKKLEKQSQAKPPRLAPPDLGGFEIPGEDVARGTEPAKALPAKAGPDTASSSLVTPEAASTGELPPDGAASPNSSLAAPNSTADASAEKSGKIVNLRIQDLKDKTRMIIDMTTAAGTPLRMSKDGKQLIVNLSSFHWGGETVWQSDHTRLIIGGRVEAGNLYVDLKHTAGLKNCALLPPDKHNKNYRLVIDLRTGGTKVK